MTDSSSIVVLGSTDVSKDNIEILREIGQAIYQSKKQLVTTKSTGVAAAVAHGFRHAGGTTSYIPDGERPDSDRILIFADNDYRSRLDAAVTDWQDKGWTFVHLSDLPTFWDQLVAALVARNGDG